MITRQDINEFFNLSNQDNAEKAKELSELDLEGKVKARKAIINLRLDANFKEVSEDGQVRLLHCEDNMSDFKEGESVELIAQHSNFVLCQCNISTFRENGDIEIVINSYNFTNDIDEHTSDVLMLLKQEVSMESFYRNFTLSTEFTKDDYWSNHLINTRPHPTIEPYSEDDLRVNNEAAQSWSGHPLNAPQNVACMNAEKTQDYFLVQGPPGTGKSHVLALRLMDEVSSCKKIVLVGPTHMAVNNALLKVAELLVRYFGAEYGRKIVPNIIFKCGQSYNAKNLSVKGTDGDDIQIKNIQYLNVGAFNEWVDKDGNPLKMGWVIGMTPYSLQSRRARGLNFDVLFVDEAGQLTIPIALMAMVKEHKVVMFGDHKQLPPIVSSKIENDELKHSIFEHLCRPDNSTMLNVTYRMNDAICRLVSDMFYNGELVSYDGAKRLNTKLADALYSGNYPVVFCHCDDNGQQTSIAEAKRAIDIVATYIKSGINPKDIAILAPFRAQCALLRKQLAASEVLSAEQRQELVIDTVDRMQGQEREIIIYSFTSGDTDYMNEMSEFLYNPQKLNVAFSRAKNKLILLGNLTSLQQLHHNLIDSMLSHSSLKQVS